jgi:K+-sensing histidine kinase KdpD
VAVAGFLITAIIVSQTALKARKRAAEALDRKRETERLYELGQAMLASESLETTVYIAINQTIRIFGQPARFIGPGKAMESRMTRYAG